MKQKLLLAALMLSMSLSLFAQSGTCGANLTWNLSNGVLTISGYGDMDNYVEHDDYGRVFHTAPWGSYKEYIQYVIFAFGVTSIGSGAFRHYENLTAVIMPNSVTTIGEEAFSGCLSLTSVTIPNSVTSIGNLAFFECQAMTSVTIPNSVTSIGELAFEDSGLIFVTIPKSVTSIGLRAFFLCDDLASIKVDASNTAYCDIDGVLYNKEKSTLIQYPVSKKGTSYTIPNSVNSIGWGAFAMCEGLKNVVIGSSVEVLEEAAFAECEALETITCYSMRPPTVEDGALEGVPYSAIVYVPADSYYNYYNHDTWGLYDVRRIGAASTETNDVKVTPTETTADVVWPVVNGAASYELVIRNTNGNIICTLVFNSKGQLTSITFNAPGRDNAPDNVQKAGFSFTVSGLKAGTTYNYTLTAKDSGGNTLDTRTGSFKTIGEGTAVEETEGMPAARTRKVMRDGVMYILMPDGRTYTTHGQEAK